jgi:hypothetical protein
MVATTIRRPGAQATAGVCPHTPACPAAGDPGHDAAHIIVERPEQGWVLLCNGIVRFDDLGELDPAGNLLLEPPPLPAPRRRNVPGARPPGPAEPMVYDRGCGRHTLDRVVGYDVVRTRREPAGLVLTVVAVVDGRSGYSTALELAHELRPPEGQWGYPTPRYLCGCRSIAFHAGVTAATDNPLHLAGGVHDA